MNSSRFFMENLDYSWEVSTGVSGVSAAASVVASTGVSTGVSTGASAGVSAGLFAASAAAAALAFAFLESCGFLGGNGVPDWKRVTRAATVSVGWAPFLRQSSYFTISMVK